MAEYLITPALETGITTGKFVLIRQSDAAFWNTSGTPAFEAYNASNIANYGIAATEIGATGVYRALNPSPMTGATYIFIKAAGASLAVTDVLNNARFSELCGPYQADVAAIASNATNATDLSNICADYNSDSAIQVDVVKWKSTTVPVPDTAGYPKITIKNGTGTGELVLTSGVASADATKMGGQAVTATTGVDLDNIIRVRRAVAAGQTARLGCDNRFGIPFHHNLGVVASMIRFGTANCLWLGDSTGSLLTTPRFRQGIIKAWDVKWAWIYGLCYSTSSDEGANTGSGAPTKYLPGETLPDGSTNDSALNCGVYTFASNVANPAGFLDFYVDWTTVSPLASADAPTDYTAGDWTRGKQVRLRILHKKLSTTIGQIRISGQRYNVGSQYNSDITLSTATGHQSVEADITDPTASVPTTAATILVGYGQTGPTSVDETGKTFAQNGFMFYLPQVRSGFGMASISEAGWSTTDHHSSLNSGADSTYYNSDGKYTQAHIQQMLSSLELPQGTINIIFIQLGINSSVGETSADEAASQVYKTNVQKIIQRYRAAYDAAGYERPWFVLVAPWLTAEGNATYLYRNLQAKRLYELAKENPQDVSFINLCGLIIEQHGGYANWSSTYLSDGTHQSAAGTLRFAQLMWQCIVDASCVHSVGRAVERESRKLLTDKGPTAAQMTTGSAFDLALNKDSSKTYDQSSDSLEALQASGGGSSTVSIEMQEVQIG